MASRCEHYRKWYYKNHEKAKRLKRENMRRYRKEHPERYRKASIKAKDKLRQSVFEIYGNVCARCGFDDKRALTLDHINNNGAEERAEIGSRGSYRRAIETHLPDEYQILCMNCQFIKQIEAGRQNQHEPSDESFPLFD